MLNDSLTGTDVSDGSIASVDVLNGSLTGLDIADPGIGSADIADHTITGDDVAAETLTGDNVADGAVGNDELESTAGGARAYGRVGSNGFLSRSKNVVGVTHPVQGLYCIDPVIGIDVSTAVLIVSPDVGGGVDTILEFFPVVGWNSAGGSGCPGDTLAVRTYGYDGDATDDDHGGGNTTGDNLQNADKSFAFVIP